MRRVRQYALVAGAAAGLWLLGPAAQAAPIIVELVSVTPQADGTFVWTYTGSIAADERIQSGPNDVPPGQSRPDFFSIYDFLGLVGTPTAPAGWTSSVQNVGVTPDFASPPSGDNPTVPNVTFTYTGAAPILGPSASIGLFNIVSTIGGINEVGSFAGETTQLGGPTDNANIYTSGSVPVPVPEPGTLLLVLAGPLFVFGAVRRGLRPRPG